MATFPLDSIKVNQPLDGLTEEIERQNTSSVRLANRAADVAIATGMPTEEVAASTESGDTTPIQTAKNTVGDPVQKVFTASVENNTDPAEASVAIQQAAEKRTDMQKFQDFVLEGALTVNDPNYDPQLHRMLINQQIAMEIFEERFKDAQEKGVIGKTVDFVDRYFLRYIGIGMYEDITKRSERKGREIATAAATMSPEEFREFSENYADELAEEGIFRGENFFALQDGLYEAINSGYDPNANLNAVLGVVDAVPLVGGSLRAAKSLTRVGALKGPEAATEAAEALSKASKGVDPEIQAEGMGRQFELTTDKQSIKPLLGRVAAIAEENKLLNDIQHLYRSGTFGRMATKEQVDRAAEQLKVDIAKVTDRPIADEDMVLVDPTSLGDYTAIVRIGKMKDGVAYETKSSADKFVKDFQNQGLAARAVQVDPNDAEKGYFVEVTERLDLTKEIDPVDTKAFYGVFRSGLSRVLGSTRQVDDTRLNSLANMGEAGFGAIREVVQPYLQRIESMDLTSKRVASQIFKDLRDGADARLRDFYSEAEFRRKFKRYHPKGKAPTEKDMDGFYAMKSVHDAAYVMQANRVALNYVRGGYKTLELGGGYRTPAKIVDNVAEDAIILNNQIGETMLRSDLPDEAVIWKVDQDLDDGVQYVTAPTNVRTIQYEDVFGYNAGGQRLNPDANYFVTLGRGAGRAVMTTYTEAQARLAKAQIGNIMSKLREFGDDVTALTDELDDVIENNKDWDPSVENTQDFIEKYIKGKGWDVRQDVGYKARDGVVEGDEDGLFSGLTMEDYVKSVNRRYDAVLPEFGGKETFNYNPIQSMVDQLSNVAAEYSFRNYTYNAKVGWLKKAGYGDQVKAGGSIDALFKNAETPRGTERGRRLAEMRGIIERREQVASAASEAMSDWGQQLGEYVFEKTGKKARFLNDLNVEGTLLNLGFRSAFGFGNLSQFFLQSSHSLAIMSISPKHGGRAAGLVLPLRLALRNGTDEAIKRLAKAGNMSETDARELVEYMRTSGRNLIENDAIEKGTGPGFGISSFEGEDLRPSVVRKGLHQTSRVVKKVDEIGLMPFNEGERLSRHTGIVTAFLEYKAKYKGANALSDDGRMWITRREQDLTFNMTTASRGMWQAGIMKVPTQWLSYSMRTLEAVVLGRQFTKMERARLAIWMAMQGGLAGVFAGAAADYFGEKFNVDPEGSAYAGLKYGVIDGILSWGLSGLSGEEVRTAFGTRLAPLTAFSDLYRKLVDESALTALGGPSGEIVGGGLGALWSAVGQVIDGNVQSAAADFERVLRTPSGVDNIVKAMGMANDGVYRSKTGTALPMEFSTLDAAMQAVGITNFDVAEFYNRRTTAFRDSRDLRSVRKELTKDFNRALSMWDSDKEAAAQLMREINARIESSGFSPVDQVSLRRSLKAEAQQDIMEMSLKQLQKDNPYGAKVIEGLME